MTFGWAPVPIGAGGYIGRVDITVNAGGTTTQKLLRPDSAGPFKYNNSTLLWEQMVTRTSMGSEHSIVTSDFLEGAYEIAAAPSDNTRIYLMYNAANSNGYVFISNDSGATWARTAGWTSVPWNPNAADKYFGPKMAVDPANKDVVYCGTPGQTGVLSVASPAVFTEQVYGRHGFVANQAVQFHNVGGALPTGVTAGTTYYVLATGLTTSTFRFSATPGGAAINSSGSTSGTTFATAGAFVTYDAGVTWQKIPNVTDAKANSAAKPMPAIGFAFDTTSGTTANTGGTGVRTNTIYLSSNGSGVWRSTNGGTSFSAMGGSPDVLGSGVISSGGVYYACKMDYSQAWRYQSATWTNITPPATSPSCAVVSPFDAATVIFAHDGGAIIKSTSYGDSGTYGNKGVFTISSPEIPWLTNAGNFIGVSHIAMDPLVNHRLWIPTGGFFAYYDIPSGVIPSSVTIVTQSKGIEETVNMGYLTPPGGTAMAFNQDRSIFRLDNLGSYRTTYYPDYVVSDHSEPIQMCTSMDYSSTDSNFIVAMINATQRIDSSGYSSDGGLTWTRFASLPETIASDRVGGTIAAATNSIMMWHQANQGDAYYTTNGGTSWTKITAATWNANGATGMINSSSGDPGWNRFRYLRRKSVTADRGTATPTFYNLNSASGGASSGAGVYKVTFPSGVLTISQTKSGFLDTFVGNNELLECVPNFTGIGASPAGKMFYTAGGGNSTALKRSFDSGVTFTSVHRTGECKAFGYGAIKSGKDFPTIFMVGTADDVTHGSTFGVFMAAMNYSDWVSNSAIVWERISADLPLDSVDFPVAISGDANTYGQCYLGYGSANTVVYADSVGGGGGTVTKARPLRLRLHA